GPKSLQPCGFPPRRQASADCNEARLRLCKLGPVPVGISLLTLVPGLVGGSETYARELTSALNRVGALDYRVFLPIVAPDAGERLPATAVRESRASMTTPGGIVAMSVAAARPPRLMRALRLGELDAIHFPLSVMLPPVERPAAATTVHDLQHELHPRFFSR